MAAGENTHLATCETVTVVVFRSLLYGPVVPFLLPPVCFFSYVHTHEHTADTRPPALFQLNDVKSPEEMFVKGKPTNPPAEQVFSNSSKFLFVQQGQRYYVVKFLARSVKGSENNFSTEKSPQFCYLLFFKFKN